MIIQKLMFFLQNVISGFKCEGDKYEEGIKKSIKKMEEQNVKATAVIDKNVGIMVGIKTIKDKKIEKIEESYGSMNSCVHASNRKLSKDIAKNAKVKAKLEKVLKED